MQSDVQDVSLVVSCRSRDETRLLQQLMVACAIHTYTLRADLKSSFEAVVNTSPDAAILICEKDDDRMHAFFKTLRSREFVGNRYLPVIVAIWNPSVASIRTAIEQGASEIVSLPANTEALTRAIYRAVFIGRPFIDVETYFGPCRRRKQVENYANRNRRKSDWEYSHISVRHANAS